MAAPLQPLNPDVYQAPHMVAQPLPTWVEDGAPDEKAHEQLLVDLVHDLLDQSREKYSPFKLKWRRTDKLAALDHVLNTAMGQDPADTRMPLLAQAMEEYLASRLDEALIPTAQSRQAEMDQIASALNFFGGVELDENKFPLLKLRLKLDQLRFRIGFLKFGVDPNKPTIFGHMGKQLITRFDPRNFWPDPQATGETWEDNRYVIYAHQMDLVDVQKQYPDKAHLVKADRRLSIERQNGEIFMPGDTSPNMLVTAGRTVGGYEIGNRERCLVLECYLKDARYRMVPIGYDNFGHPQVNSENRPILIAQDRYPKGRLIVVCGNVLLRDSENPYDHGLPPTATFKESPYDGWFSFSPLEVLDIVDRKINQLMKEMHNNILMNMNSPIMVGRRAFSKPSQYDEMKVKAGEVWIVNENSKIERLNPGVLSPDAAPYIDRLNDVFDNALGTTDLNRGNLEKGTQISAQGVQDLQGATMSRKQLKTELDKQGMEHGGKLLFSNIRQFYPGTLSVQVKDPATGQNINYDWDASQWKNDWGITIQVSSSSPGSKASADDQAIQLFKDGIVDQQFVLQQLKIPLDVKTRMDQMRVKLATLGFVKEAINFGKPKGTGRPTQAA